MENKNYVIKQIINIIQNQPPNLQSKLINDTYNQVIKKKMSLLKEYIQTKWNCCHNLRHTIQSKGVKEFYETRAVPVNFEIYQQFALDNKCWCDQCQEN